MNRADATDVQDLLTWVLDLTLWQHATTTTAPTDEHITATITRLAERSHHTLGTGLDAPTALAAAGRLTATPGEGSPL